MKHLIPSILIGLLCSSLACAAPKPHPLFDAVANDDVAALERYVAGGGDVNINNCKALWSAYHGRKFNAVTYLESVGAKANAHQTLAFLILVQVDLTVAKNMIELYRLDHKKLPATLALAVAGAPATESTYAFDKDFWGRPLVYKPQGNSYILGTYGFDGKPGGSGFSRDIFLSTSEDEIEAAEKSVPLPATCRE
ncbi:MAG: type II secretion system protein GspG [Massilia sp.]